MNFVGKNWVAKKSLECDYYLIGTYWTKEERKTRCAERVAVACVVCVRFACMVCAWALSRCERIRNLMRTIFFLCLEQQSRGTTISSTPFVWTLFFIQLA